MCDDHGGLSRRAFLGGTAATLAAPVFARGGVARRPPRRLPLRSPARPHNAAGDGAYSMAMHIHSSFSEFDGSMDQHLSQATANSVDVLWWTDHDQRMNALDYRKTVHFTSLTKETGAAGEGGAWTWQKQESGPLASSAGGIVTTPCSPNDPVVGGALHVNAKSSSTTAARVGYYANSHPADLNYHDTLAGQTVSIDVRPGKGWEQGYLEVAIATSLHPASGGRPAGEYALSYRIVPGAVASTVAQGNLGVITIPAPAAKWTTVTITPENDIAVLWPDLDQRDFAFAGLTLWAVSLGDQVGGYFDYLRFSRSISGEAALNLQQDMMTAYAAKYPAVEQVQGLEISLSPRTGATHVNWFGPGVQILPYPDMDLPDWLEYLSGTAIPQIHATGGLASYNHPYGTSRSLQSAAQQDAMLTQVATTMLGNQALGADLVEIGYPRRGGCDLAHHAGVWDVLSRNAVFLTGTGVSDDHVGSSWAHQIDNWTTSAWAASSGLTDLLAGLAAGQAWCGDLALFNTTAGASLNLTVDGCPMGSVSLSSLTSRQLAITGTGIPSGGSVAVLQGTVDYAGTANPAPDTTAVASFTDAELAAGGGTVTYAADTTDECFARLQVADSTGTVVALSNPVWMLHNAPPNGIPAPRQV